jgi:hypothetical protein
MGNNQSGAQVSVQLNQDGGLICGGSKLSGTVYLNVEKDSVKADSLNVKFYGHEATQVQYQESYSGSEGKAETRTVTVQEQHQLVCVDYVLCNNYANCEVLKGRYEYPFEITLPDFLPGKQGQKYGGNWFVIEYLLEARLHRSGLLTFDVKNSQEILLSDKPYEIIEKTPSFIEPICRPVYFFCCYKTGTMTLLANVDTTTVFMKDILRIEYAVRNDSTSTVKAVEINIKKIEQFHAQHHAQVLTSSIYKQRIESSTGLDNFSFPDKNLESLHKAVRGIEATIPNENGRPSYNGFLGSVRNCLCLTLKIECILFIIYTNSTVVILYV